ncbi:MAG TPA: ATP-binding protein [Candidatus Ozemobacteraceae bacterium]|nr:ATP-binding protein [Candidatus Ozemobacteraceae bacterium]
MSVKTKLLIAMIPTVLALVCVGLMAAFTISDLGLHSQRILKDNYRSVLAIQRITNGMERLDSGMLFCLSGRQAEGTGMIREFRPLVEEEIRIEEGNVTESGEAELAKILRSLWIEYQGLYDGAAGLDGNAFRERYFSAIYPVFMRLKKTAEAILTLNQAAMVRKSEDVKAHGEFVTRLMILLSLLASIGGIALTMFMGQRILRPLNVLALAARRVGEGDLEVRAVLEEKDEFADLAKEFNAMTEHLETYRKSSLGDLLQAQHSMQATIDSLPDPVAIFAADGSLLEVNAVAEAELEFDWKWIKSALPEKLRNLIVRIRDHVLSGKGPWAPHGFDDAVGVPLPRGDVFYLLRGMPVTDRDGIRGAIVLFQDVTRWRRMDQLRNDLVATVAHEFRTPLTSLHMAIHLLLEGSVARPERREDLLFAAREDCERLQALVDEILDLSRLQSGKIRILPHPVRARLLLEEALSAHRLLAEENGLQLVSEIALGNEWVLADSERIHVVFRNLVANAVKHTPRGRDILLRASLKDRTVRFEVADEGEGIPEEYLGRVFERFYRVPGAKGSGSGLGLSIVREIIAGHGGEISVTSRVGVGSCFAFTLPLVSDPDEPKERGPMAG